MNKNSKIFSIILAIIILIGIGAFLLSLKKTSEAPEVAQNNNTEESIVGCYVSRTGKDVYTLKINSNENGNVIGALNFNNFQKDSSSGTFTGAYDDGILWGNYAFTSEGMDSVMQVIFKKTPEGFVRGYGPVDQETGTAFTDLNKITYDESSSLNVFKFEPCPTT